MSSSPRYPGQSAAAARRPGNRRDTYLQLVCAKENERVSQTPARGVICARFCDIITIRNGGMTMHLRTKATGALSASLIVASLIGGVAHAQKRVPAPAGNDN